MLQHIADTLPPALHLPISPLDTLHFYRYLRTHVLIENKQFLLLINIPIQDRAHQITIHEVFTLDIPLWKLFSPLRHQNKILWSNQRCHNGSGAIKCTIQNMQVGQWTVLPHANTFPTLGKPPNMHSCALYTKSAASIESNCFLQLCKTTMTPLPTQITPDVWILITPPSAPSDAISLICPEKPMTTTPVR